MPSFEAAGSRQCPEQVAYAAPWAPGGFGEILEGAVGDGDLGDFHAIRHHQTRDPRRSAWAGAAHSRAESVIQLAAPVHPEASERIGKNHAKPQGKHRREDERAQRADGVKKVSFAIGRAQCRAELAPALRARSKDRTEYAAIAHLNAQQKISQPVLAVSGQRDKKLAVAIFQPVMEDFHIREEPVVLRRLDPQVLRQIPVLPFEAVDAEPDAIEAIPPRQFHELL